MSPEQIELAQAAMKLPGAPKPSTLGGGCIEKSSLFDDGQTTGERFNGILWIWWPLRRPEERIPDLADPTGATDGVLLKLLGPRLAAYYSYVTLEWAICIPFGGVIARSPRLADACCEAAVALGRWPGGAP